MRILDNAFLNALMAESVARPGEHRSPDAHIIWGEHAIVVTRNDEAPIVLERHNLASVQLSRSEREPPRALLRRQKRHQHILHAELRSRSGHRLRFQAQVHEISHLKGLPTLETRGIELPLDALRDLVLTATSLGAHIAGWNPADTRQARAVHDASLDHLASLQRLWPDDLTADVAEDDPNADFNSLLAAVELAEDWLTLRIAPGTYKVSRPLIIERPLRLIGAGHDATRIICEAPGTVVRVEPGCALFAATDIAFEHAGTLPADVLVVDAAAVDLLRCLFTGGQLDHEGDCVGHGVVLLEGSRGGLRGCESTRNTGDGFHLEHGDSNLVVDGNTAEKNGEDGIAISEASGGLLRGNTAQKNSGHGVLIADTSFPRLEQNTCKGNALSGIHVQDDALGVLESNTCERNAEHGISVSSWSRPILKNNHCNHNTSTGITVLVCASPLVHSNVCNDNTVYGVYVGGEATPRLEHNVCKRNGRAGFAFRDQSAPHANHDSALHNLEHGYYIGEQSKPELLDCSARSNTGCGVLFRDRSAGVMRRCTCADNTLDGVQLGDHAAPELNENTATGNGEDGFSLRDTAAAWLHHNHAQLNIQDGIYVDRSAVGVKLEDNRTDANGGEDVRDERGRPAERNGEDVKS